MALDMIASLFLGVAIFVWFLYAVAVSGLDIVNIFKTFTGENETKLPENSDNC